MIAEPTDDATYEKLFQRCKSLVAESFPNIEFTLDRDGNVVAFKGFADKDIKLHLGIEYTWLRIPQLPKYILPFNRIYTAINILNDPWTHIVEGWAISERGNRKIFRQVHERINGLKTREALCLK